MTRLPRLSARKILTILLKAGFYVHHQTGSHINLRHSIKIDLRLVVPKHSGELAPKTIKSIISQSGFSIEQFLNLLVERRNGPRLEVDRVAVNHDGG